MADLMYVKDTKLWEVKDHVSTTVSVKALLEEEVKEAQRKLLEVEVV